VAGFAVITGASTGIGLELALLAAKDGYDLLLAADTPYDERAEELVRAGTARAMQADLSTPEGVERLLQEAGGRKIDLLCANAGRGLGRSFLEQEVSEWRHVIETNITGTVYLLQRVLRDMVARNAGKVLVTGSIAGFIPGSYQSVYNGTKAFIDSFTDALRDELKDVRGVTITTLMPGPTDTAFFERADMLDTDVGTSDSKDDPANVAKTGYDALMAGKASVVAGWKNKLQAAAAHVLPASVLAKQHRNMAKPGTDE